MSKREVKEEIIEITLKGSEILERNVSKFGTGAHVIVPSEYVGKKVKIVFDGGGNEK